MCLGVMCFSWGSVMLHVLGFVLNIQLNIYCFFKDLGGPEKDL